MGIADDADADFFIESCIVLLGNDVDLTKPCFEDDAACLTFTCGDETDGALAKEARGDSHDVPSVCEITFAEIKHVYTKFILLQA